ncbi:MAG TPA: lytic transglycosylase domain-containing protein [Parasegetibacter sp.]
MALKKMISGFLSLLVFTAAQAAGVKEQPPTYTSAGVPVTDTASDKLTKVAGSTSKNNESADININSFAVANTDIKSSFKDLFDVDENTSGVSYAHLNPHAIDFVKDYVKTHSKKLEKMKEWGKPYFDMIEDIFEKHGLPTELKYLAVVESNLRTHTSSVAGASGPWQFIPSTARVMGLKVNSKVDERNNYVKSTHAAAKYLKQLYSQLDDWLLVIAAYNSGPGRVQSAIKKSGTRNFWKLQHNLPAESRNHVKKFIATHYIMEGKGGVTTLTTKELTALQTNYLETAAVRAEMDNTRVQPISGKYNSHIIAKVLEMDLADFNALNPGFDAELGSGKTYDLKLPTDKMDVFNANRYMILSESVQVLMNSVKRN